MTLAHAARLLESPSEESFDRLTRLAARLLGAPVSLVTLMADDRAFFKSAVGLVEPWASERSTPLAYSFCRHVVASAAPLVIEDARRHPLVRSNPAVRELHWIAYAGVPLTMADGETVGALAVIDALPRIWSPRDLALLEDLAACVVTEIEIRALRCRPADTASADVELRGAAALPALLPPDPAAAVFEGSALPMGLLQATGRWLRVNQALADLLGTTPEALAGTLAEAATHPADRSADDQAMRLLQAGECASYRTEKRLRREGEEPRWVLATVTALPGAPQTAGLFHVAIQDLSEHKRAELELQTREQRYRLAAELNLDAVWDWDFLTDRLVWDEREAGIFGYSRPPAGLSAAWWYERLHGDDRERVVSGIHAAIAGGANAWTDEYRFRRSDGAYATVRDRAAVIRDAAGDAVRMVGAVTDTTQRARTERLARAQSRLLEQIAAGLDLDAVLERVARLTEAHGSGDVVAIIMLLDPEARVLRLGAGPSLSPALRVVLSEVPLEPAAGLSALVALGREPVVLPDLAADVPAEGWRGPLLEHGVRSAWSTPLFATDGALLGTLEVHAREPRLPDDADRRLVEQASHLAEIAIERDRSQQAVARGMRLFEQVLDTLPVGVWVVERDGRIMFGNPAGRAIWGSGPPTGSDAAGPPRGRRDASGEPLAPEEWAAARALRAGETAINEVVQVDTAEGPRTILDSAVPLRSLDGSIAGAILIQQDITEQRAGQEALRRSEEQLRQAQKMEAVGQLAGGIAHDFNNLLTAILSYSDLILQELREGDPIRGDLQQIRQAGERAAALTRQLLAFSRRQVLQPRVVSLTTSVREVEGMLRRLLGAEVTLETELDPLLWHVLADPGQLEQVLVNLVVNARDAMPAGGRITVGAANRYLGVTDEERGNGVGPGAYVTLSVSDTGVGMDVPTQARIFDPFFTTKPAGQGTGLGLSMVYGIVQQSGGHITVESAPGQGATFTIFLPRHEGAGGALPALADRRGLPCGTETLLLVEDEAAVRSSARRLLERHGYTVIEARHGADALRIAETTEHSIDMVLTDLVMPEMGGRELVERLRARQPSLKVLYMSGYSERAVTVDGVMPPATGFVDKPFTIEQLTRRTREILDGA